MVTPGASGFRYCSAWDSSTIWVLGEAGGPGLRPADRACWWRTDQGQSPTTQAPQAPRSAYLLELVAVDVLLLNQDPGNLLQWGGGRGGGGVCVERAAARRWHAGAGVQQETYQASAALRQRLRRQQRASALAQRRRAGCTGPGCRRSPGAPPHLVQDVDVGGDQVLGAAVGALHQRLDLLVNLVSGLDEWGRGGRRGEGMGGAHPAVTGWGLSVSGRPTQPGLPALSPEKSTPPQPTDAPPHPTWLLKSEGCAMDCPRKALPPPLLQATWPSFLLKPSCVTMRRAVRVTCWKSPLAPVVMSSSPKMSSSATRPPSATAIWFSK